MSPSPTAAVTIRDVAEAAGVHISTVSRALSPDKRGLISQEVLRLVEATATRLGYRVHRGASALRTGRTHTIGVLVPDITNAVFPPILQGIEASAAARGYFVFVANVPDAALAGAVIERMLAQRVDGLILATATRHDPAVDLVQRAGVKTVLVNRADDTRRLSAVVSDDACAMRLAVDHLVALGHTRIAHLAGPRQVPTGAGRRRAVEQSLRRHGLASWATVECDSYSREAGARAMQQLLAHEAGPPQAVVCCNDLVALGAYDAAASARLRIPRDISVTGHNDMPLVDMVHPPLTTIRLQHRELGWQAAEMLFARIAGEVDGPATTVKLRPELVVRGSTAPPRPATPAAAAGR